MSAAAAPRSSSGGAPPADAVCWVCLDPAGRRTRSRAAELQRGCSCRGDSGWLHFPCLLKMSDQQEELGNDGARCPTCKQQFTGRLELELGRAKFARVAGRPADDLDRLQAAFYLAETLRFNVGNLSEARCTFWTI